MALVVGGIASEASSKSTEIPAIAVSPPFDVSRETLNIDQGVRGQGYGFAQINVRITNSQRR